MQLLDMVIVVRRDKYSFHTIKYNKKDKPEIQVITVTVYKKHVHSILNESIECPLVALTGSVRFLDRYTFEQNIYICSFNMIKNERNIENHQ